MQMHEVQAVAMYIAAQQENPQVASQALEIIGMAMQGLARPFAKAASEVAETVSMVASAFKPYHPPRFVELRSRTQPHIRSIARRDTPSVVLLHWQLLHKKLGNEGIDNIEVIRHKTYPYINKSNTEPVFVNAKFDQELEDILSKQDVTSPVL